MGWVDKLNRRAAEAALGRGDPLREPVQAIMRGKEQIGTAPLLDLLGMAKPTGNARRVGRTVRATGVVPLKSRRLEPGGYRDTVTRGWTRPFRGKISSPARIPNTSNQT